MKLATTTLGEANGQPPVLMTHGLYGQGRNLGVIARHLATTRQVILIDQRNHGDSPHADDHSYAALADDLAGVARAAGAPVDVVGHSMGGKTAMAMALAHPELVRRLVVLDIAPIAYGHDQTALIDAMEGLDLTGLTARSEADRRLSATVEDAGIRAFLLQSLDLRADPPRWRLNLPVLRRAMPDLVGWPGHEGQSWPGPALLLAGAEGDYVTPAGEAAARAAFPAIAIRHVEGTGHWLHADKPAEVGGLIAAFLNAPAR